MNNSAVKKKKNPTNKQNDFTCHFMIAAPHLHCLRTTGLKEGHNTETPSTTKSRSYLNFYEKYSQTLESENPKSLITPPINLCFLPQVLTWDSSPDVSCNAPQQMKNNTSHVSFKYLQLKRRAINNATVSVPWIFFLTFYLFRLVRPT